MGFAPENSGYFIGLFCFRREMVCCRFAVDQSAEVLVQQEVIRDLRLPSRTLQLESDLQIFPYASEFLPARPNCFFLPAGKRMLV
jgi:hypothetical protein